MCTGNKPSCWNHCICGFLWYLTLLWVLTNVTHTKPVPLAKSLLSPYSYSQLPTDFSFIHLICIFNSTCLKVNSKIFYPQIYFSVCIPCIYCCVVPSFFQLTKTETWNLLQLPPVPATSNKPSPHHFIGPLLSSLFLPLPPKRQLPLSLTMIYSF